MMDARSSVDRKRVVRALAASCLLVVLAATGSGCRSAKNPPETGPRSPEPAAPTVPQDATEPEATNVHTVRRGETLWSIARRYGVSVDDFVIANDIADPDRLAVGRQLIIPAGASVSTWSWPVAGGEILSGFGSDRGTEIHRGLDIRAREGQPVVAAWSGVVVYSGADMRDYGKAIILDHGGGLTSLYGHNSELLVAAGDQVVRGQTIALAGKSGNATTVHCHFEVRKNAVALDPLGFLGSRD